MPDSTLVPCRGCGKGEYRDEASNRCMACEDGFFQSLDNHMEENNTIITKCQECPEGYYAPKVHDFSHFEHMPDIFLPSCSIAT